MFKRVVRLRYGRLSQVIEIDLELAARIDSGPNSTDLDADSYDVFHFDQCFEGYFWNYDNKGLKLLELRFYPERRVSAGNREQE